MPHPVTTSDTLAALVSNAQSITEFFSSLPDDILFDGDPEHWSPAHHLAHLTHFSALVGRALRSGELPTHPTGRSRTYAEVRDAATSSLMATPKNQLLEMGRKNVLAADAQKADLVVAFATASAELREAASRWSEDALDRHALKHPLIGDLTVREMLLFFVVHERHHLKTTRARVAA